MNVIHYQVLLENRAISAGEILLKITGGANETRPSLPTTKEIAFHCATGGPSVSLTT